MLRMMNGLGKLHDRLYDGLWHVTHPCRVPDIVQAGALLVEPDIDNSERWKTGRGPDYYPFVRHLGGVSLFDFQGFDATRYSETHPMSSWQTFVSHMRDWGGAVWIEIDRDALADNLVSADDLVALWDRDGNRQHTIMPRIEAAHIGDLPASAFCSAFLTWARGTQVREFDILNFDQSHFDEFLREWGSESGCRQ